MKRLHVGDHVRVANLPASPWQNRIGKIVEILEHGTYEAGKTRQECALDLEGKRCWFMDKHLVKSVPARVVRFFRAEVSEQWHLEQNDVGSLNGDREELVGLLCDRLNFAMRRAEAEVDDFYISFDERIARTIEQRSSERPPLNNKPPEGVHTQTPKRRDAA
jgi:hypothetical protein